MLFIGGYKTWTKQHGFETLSEKLHIVLVTNIDLFS